MLVTGLPGTGKTTIADAAAGRLGVAVLGHDWAISGLRPYPLVEEALNAMDPPGHREVGWSILRALARAQLRRGVSVVLDGVARAPQIDACRTLGAEEAARLLVVVTTCDDVRLHRSRLEGRRRNIPGWYELDWSDVGRSRAGWIPIVDADLVLDAGNPVTDNIGRLAALIDASRHPDT